MAQGDSGKAEAGFRPVLGIVKKVLAIRELIIVIIKASPVLTFTVQ